MKEKKKIKLCIIVLVLSITVTIVSKVYAAGNGNSWSVGVYYDNEVDTTGDAILAAKSYRIRGYSYDFECHPTYEKLRGKAPNGIYRMESAVQFYSGHGNYDHIAFNDHKKGGYYATGIYYDKNWYSNNSGYTYAGIKSYDLSNVNLITFAACDTASNYDNICRRAYERGVTTTVGWNKTVGAESHSEWLRRYNERLGKGDTVKKALAYADSFTYDDINVKSHSFYGDANLKLEIIQKTNSLTATVSEREALASFIYIDDKLLFEKMNEVVTEFDINDYEVSVKKNELYKVIDLYKKVDGVKSMEGFSIIIDNGKVAVYKNSVDTNNIGFITKKLDNWNGTTKHFSVENTINTFNKRSSGEELKILSQEKIYDVSSGNIVTYYRIVSILPDGGKAVMEVYE